MTSLPETSKRLTPELAATALIVLAYLVWILSLPLWPSQDGPMHLYYTQVFGALLSHQAGPYAQYFTIRHLLPPYALYYYALLALSKVVPLVLADRLIICAYLFSFVFGFRYFARALGPGADLMTLCATLLLFNWSLGMGFVNFCFSLSFAFWAIGVWLRFSDRTGGQLDLRRRVGFVALAFVIMFTHPVPLIFFLAVCGVFFLVDLLLRKDPARSWTRRGSVRDLVTLAVASLTMLYVKLFTTAHPFTAVGPPEQVSYISQLVTRTLAYAREDGVIPLFGHILPIYIYRLGIAFLLIFPIVMGVRQRMRNRAARVWTAGDTMLVLGLLLLVLLPVIPPELNGLFFFAARLPLIVWIGLLLAASGSVSLSSAGSDAAAFRRTRVALIVFAFVSNAAILWAGERIVRPIATTIAAVEKTPATLNGRVGFVITDPRDVPGKINQPVWTPFFWADVDVVRHNHAILANAPWMDETILPVGAGPELPVEKLPALQSRNPLKVYGLLLASPAQLTAIMSEADFFVVNQIDHPNDGYVAKGLIDGVPAQRNLWSCAAGPSAWYLLCQKQPPSAHP